MATILKNGSIPSTQKTSKECDNSDSADRITVTGARLLCEALVREGVNTLFGIPGGAVLPLYDDLGKMKQQLRHVLARHEQGAVHMAEGYAKATGRVGVAVVTSGPGATNAVTGIANAYMDSTPLVVISGQVPRKMIGTDAFQEVDTVGITRSCTKYNYMVMDAREITEIVKEAFFLASNGRPGPVLIDLPKDVSAEKVPAVFSLNLNLPGYHPEVRGGQEEVEEAAKKIAIAKRPILYVGGGIIHANACEELLELAELMNLPVAPTLMGLGGFPSGHAQSLGMLGMHGTYWANMAISESDLIIAVGVRFDDRVTGAIEKFAPHAEIIHVDIDHSSISKNVRATIPIIGDSKAVLQQLLEALQAEECGSDEGRLAQWWEQIEEWKRRAPLTYESADDVIKPQLLCQELLSLTKGDAIIVTDVGQHQMWLAQYYRFNKPRQSITSGGLGTMGFGLPAAIGAQMAKPDSQVIAFVGDGGFQMTAQELATAVTYRTNTKILVMNNRYLGMVRQWQDLFFDRSYTAVNTEGAPDFVKLAEAYGAKGFRATHPSHLREVLEKGLATPGVVVMDVLVSAEENVYPMIPPGAGLKEMVLK